MGLSAGTIDAVAWRSPWRSRPVAEKAVLFGGLLVSALVLPTWPAAPLLILVCLFAARLAGVPIRHLIRCLKVPAAFILTAAASTMISVDLTEWGFSISHDTVSGAASLVARAITASMAMLLFASTTPMTSLTAALRQARVPPACVDVITVMYRLVFVLLESIAVIHQAQVSRLGYTSARRAVRSSGLLTAAVLVRSLTQAQRLEQGLAGRDFGVPMPILGEARIHPRFVALSSLTLGAVAAVSLATGALL